MFVDKLTDQIKEQKGSTLTKEELDKLISNAIISLNACNEYDNIKKHLTDVDA